MSDICPVIKIESKESPDGFVEINAEDFDPAKHVEFNAEKPVAQKARVKRNESDS